MQFFAREYKSVDDSLKAFNEAVRTFGEGNMAVTRCLFNGKPAVFIGTEDRAALRQLGKDWVRGRPISVPGDIADALLQRHVSMRTKVDATVLIHHEPGGTLQGDGKVS